MSYCVVRCWCCTTPCTTLYDASYIPDASGPDALYDTVRRVVRSRRVGPRRLVRRPDASYNAFPTALVPPALCHGAGTYPCTRQCSPQHVGGYLSSTCKPHPLWPATLSHAPPPPPALQTPASAPTATEPPKLTKPRVWSLEKGRGDWGKWGNGRHSARDVGRGGRKRGGGGSKYPFFTVPIPPFSRRSKTFPTVPFVTTNSPHAPTEEGES